MSTLRAARFSTFGGSNAKGYVMFVYCGGSYSPCSCQHPGTLIFPLRRSSPFFHSKSHSSSRERTYSRPSFEHGLTALRAGSLLIDDTDSSCHGTLKDFPS